MLKLLLLLSLVFFIVSSLAAQETKGLPDKEDVQSESVKENSSQTGVENKLPGKVPVITEEKLPSGARLYVAAMSNGFDTYIIAGLQKKNVPVVITTDRSKADFELSGVSETAKAG